MVIIMNQLAVFINLFFVPLLPLIVIYREKRKPLEPNLDLLFQYGIIAACNIPLTKVSVVLIREIVGSSITMDSGYYTLAAFLPTILAFFGYKFYKTYPDHDPWKEKITQKGIKGIARDLAPACILLFVSCFMLFLFEPILAYASNMEDFWFDFPIMIGPVLGIFVGFFLIGIGIVFAIYTIDLLISKRLLLYKGFTLIGSIIFFLTYLQGNWLAGNLPVLNGEEIVWESYGKRESIVLILAILIIVIAIINLIKKRGLSRTVLYITTCTSIVFVMLFASLIPTVVTNGALLRKDTFISTVKNFNTISSNKNFLIFLVDTVDTQTFYNIMMEDDDFRDLMTDFTYYPDSLSVYPQTHDSIPNILTGTVYRNETNYMDYSSNACNQSPLFEKLTQSGYEINLYGEGSIAWEGERNYVIENSGSMYDDSLDLNGFMKQELKYILFKYLPYGLKQFSKIETLDFGACRIVNSEYDPYTWGDKVNYKRITENPILDKQDQNYFQFIQVEGAHKSYNLDKDLNTVKDGTYEQKVGTAATMIKTYLQRLKDNDAYDNSAIVIMSDHGQAYWPEQPKKQLSRCNPILFIKGIGEKHEMLESDRPVSYVDLQDAFCDLIDGKQSTELFADLKQGRTRTIYWQTDKTRDHKIEYETTGKAWELDKFAPTGNVFDLKE